MVLWQRFDVWQQTELDLVADLHCLPRTASKEIFKVIMKAMPNVFKAFLNHCRISQGGTSFQLIVFLTMAENSDSKGYHDMYQWLSR